MNILVIGNGFDLAHGLPTKYGDFLDFVSNSMGSFKIDGKEISFDIIDKLIKINKFTGFCNLNEFDKWLNNHEIIKEKTEGTLITQFLQNINIKYTVSLGRKEISVDKSFLRNNFTNIKKYYNNYFTVSYKDFDDELKYTIDIWKYIFFIKWVYEDDELKNKFHDFHDNKINKIKDKLQKNYWIKHFEKRRKEIGEGWIDFEQEMLDVLKKLEYNENSFYKIFFDILNYYHQENKEVIEKGDLIAFEALIEISSYNKDNIIHVNDDDFKEIYSNFINENDDVYKYKSLCMLKESKITSKNAWEILYSSYEKFICKRLIDDMNNLISAFELYLKFVVEEIQVQGNNKDILNIGAIDNVISFNYTHTIKNYKKDATDIDYIHGEVREHININNNNMVLGVDEYLPDDKKNKYLNFIHFKKYFQRIYKNTGAYYKTWLTTKDINIYFFGHSLDSSDKDILKELLDCENAKIKIFYVNEEQKATQISNLVKIIGQDKLIAYTYNKTKFGTDAKIQFIKQEYELYMNLLQENLQENYYNVMKNLSYINKWGFIDSHLQDCMRLFDIIIYNFFLEEQKDDKEEFKKRIEEIRHTKNIEKLNELIKDFEEKLKQKV